MARLAPLGSLPDSLRWGLTPTHPTHPQASSLDKTQACPPSPLSLYCLSLPAPLPPSPHPKWEASVPTKDNGAELTRRQARLKNAHRLQSGFISTLQGMTHSPEKLGDESRVTQLVRES